jgi:hypothetical protein
MADIVNTLYELANEIDEVEAGDIRGPVRGVAEALRKGAEEIEIARADLGVAVMLIDKAIDCLMDAKKGAV